MTNAYLERVLIVDDDSHVQIMVMWALEDMGGLTVHTSSSGAQACAAAPVFAPDLIILDIHMPGMDGWQALAALRAFPETATTPVIILSTSERPDPSVFAPGNHVIGFIAKPFDPLTFTAQVRDLWATAHLH